MNLKEKSVKRISGLLIVSILFLNFAFFSFTPEAEAVLGVGDIGTVNINSNVDPGTVAFYTAAKLYFTKDTGLQTKISGEQTTQDVWTKAQAAAVKVGEAILRNLARRLIQQITEKTVDWIRGGFKGNPAYISQPLKFLVNTADATVGDMIFNDPDLNFLCSPFQIQIRLALGFSFQTFRSRINCTLSGVSRNVQNAVRGASATVNVWDNWIETTTNPQNTPIGAYLIAREELGIRIGNKQFDLQSQLNRGFGSLTYEECTGTRTPKGQLGPGEPYTFKGSRFYEEQSRDNNHYTYGPLKCDTKTPGAVITNMLGFKANSDQRTSELVAALGDGIDTIFAALVDTLLKKALSQLTNGVLGTNNTAESVQYNLDLSTLASRSQANYNDDVMELNTAGVTNPGNLFNQYNGVFSPSSTSSLSNNAISGTSNNSTVLYSQGFNQLSYNPTSGPAANPLDAVKANALSGISYYLGTESAYQSTLAFASSTLTAARAIFVTARNCNVSYNTWPTTLRAGLINSNVIQNIDGTPNVDQYRVLAQIPWNLTAINNWENISNNNVSILNTAQASVNSATTQQQITDAMTPVNSTSFNTDPQKDMVANIKTWLRGVRDIYSTPQCPINIDKVLAATSTASFAPSY